MEYSILLTIGATSALGLAVLYSILMSGSIYTWLAMSIDQSENAFQDLNNAFCAAVPAGTAKNSCRGDISTASWVQGAGGS